jgi:hypothetical protein
MLQLGQTVHVRSHLDERRSEAEHRRLAAVCRTARRARPTPEWVSRILGPIAGLRRLVGARP